MLSAEDNLEALITKRIKEIAGAVAAVFSEYNSENRTITTRNIEVEPGLLEKVVSLLGKQVHKIHSIVSDEVYREMTSKIFGMRKTLHEASFGAVPRPVGAAIQALLKVDRFIGVAYLIEGKLYGTSLLAMSEGQPDPSKQILESFSFLAAVSLRRKWTESQKEAALAALREREEELRQLFMSMINAFVLFDSIFDDAGNFTSYRFVYINDAYERITGVKNEEVKGKSIHEVWPETEPEWIRRYGEVAVTGLSQEFEMYHDPTKKLYHCNVYRPWNRKGRFCVLFEDITERKQAEEEIKRQLAEKEILLKEVHHRIKNNIGSVESLLSLHSQSTTNPEAISVLQDAIGRVGSMRILYDKLLLSEDYKDISVKNYLEDLIDTIIAIFPSQAKITLDKQIADFHLDSKRLFPLGIIINELLTNKLKYAFIDKKAGAIKISLTHVHDHVSLSIEDNGSGLPDGFDSEQAKGFGLMLVKMLSQQLGGSFSMEKQAGTRCKVVFTI